MPSEPSNSRKKASIRIQSREPLDRDADPVGREYVDRDLPPESLSGATRAVPAGPHEMHDVGHGGIIRRDIVDASLIAPLNTFAVGAEVYVESDDVMDGPNTRIWWRAIVLSEHPRAHDADQLEQDSRRGSGS